MGPIDLQFGSISKKNLEQKKTNSMSLQTFPYFDGNFMTFYRVEIKMFCPSFRIGSENRLNKY